MYAAFEISQKCYTLCGHNFSGRWKTACRSIWHKSAGKWYPSVYGQAFWLSKKSTYIIFALREKKVSEAACFWSFSGCLDLMGEFL